MKYSYKTEKQARLDAFEIRELFPALREGNFWELDALVNARRASAALFAADTRCCNDYDVKAAIFNQNNAERHAMIAVDNLNYHLNKALKAANSCGVTCAIHNNGLRYLEIKDNDHSYRLID